MIEIQESKEMIFYSLNSDVVLAIAEKVNGTARRSILLVSRSYLTIVRMKSSFLRI